MGLFLPLLNRYGNGDATVLHSNGANSVSHSVALRHGLGRKGLTPSSATRIPFGDVFDRGIGVPTRAVRGNSRAKMLTVPPKLKEP